MLTQTKLPKLEKGFIHFFIIVIALISIAIVTYLVLNNTFDIRNQAKGIQTEHLRVGESAGVYCLGQTLEANLDEGDSRLFVRCSGRTDLTTRPKGGRNIYILTQEESGYLICDNGTFTLNWASDSRSLEALCSSISILPTLTPTPTPKPTSTPALTLSPTPEPVTDGVPFAPFHFGESAGDYNVMRNGVRAGDLFTGAFMSIGSNSAITTVESLFAAAKAEGSKVIASPSVSDPCYYWDGATFNQSQFVTDIKRILPSIVKYKDTVIGIMVLNEPHDPTRCVKIPASTLYNVAKAVRAEFVPNGLASNFPFGYGVHPSYFLTVANDGTINFANAQYTPKKGTVQSFVTSQQADATTTGMKLYFTVNATQDLNLASDLKYMCDNLDKSRVLMVGYWTWGNTAVDFSTLLAARDSCKAR
ncbi:hypothetical protein A3A76_00270 [Candidatus Woesebacteria bacterium RIFCSPLOWO2_01_FULL_39_23]|uniref:Uncharacterized protein n=1 Tax=Candidatus Woesebacteria bacterium RIFCSPHIGHO2_01_FULL_40_22 TaxID=1802499 RepID=A0A1F7YG46_9BACT|nr:MAG: hypothetical protein A2141_02870 [Candidatus Woesebacteria bacterium RBG_16_40_11]OGM26316.1 MAG: hypothetical protein A2628_03890 [Candidatus Woesebacteria bacterium RIFCSPHIGHO2_01_FULL_40_22]OGM38422.1 MAG: hypothetical protein A3E41_00140 [Candidatus Woesebacteria bacterium RIFCSPHIGHO2_12_FULL_38_9]OGM62871.1 MAG: hypothetical protein A3A76_00270 [Candidatus Woesebacteria bacterium RIFCSPLOWO2_01_FULL_39_23]